MDLAGYLRELRKEARDDYSTQWSDSVLTDILKDSFREYCIASDRYVVGVPVVCNESNVYSLPDGFLRAIRFEDIHGVERPFIGWADAGPDLRKRSGARIDGVVMRYDGPQKFRLFPRQTQYGEVVGTMYCSVAADFSMLPSAESDFVVEHALFTMMLLDGKGSYQKHYSKFESMVNSRYSGGDTIRNRRIRRGVFY